MTIGDGLHEMAWAAFVIFALWIIFRGQNR
jgi:hypothetical protein